MAFGSTFTLTFNSVNKVLNRINQDAYGSEYLLRTTTEEYRMKVRHSTETVKNPDPLTRGMDRHNIEITHVIFATTTTPQITRQAYSVYRIQPGDDLTAAGYFLDGANAMFATNTVETDMLNWVS